MILPFWVYPAWVVFGLIGTHLLLTKTVKGGVPFFASFLLFAAITVVAMTVMVLEFGVTLAPAPYQ